MRIDKFLQVAGLIKRRVLANEACKRGLVLVDGIPVKPTREIKAGETIEIKLPHRETEVKLIKDLGMKTLPKARRPEFLEIIRDEIKDQEPEDLFSLPTD
ncbi:MAG: hypothetical protein HQM08_12240 [Candidatus Riflebacteria bacterium]|nr:hypothetical protein [Candidatus Riflebacteria bacterium]